MIRTTNRKSGITIKTTFSGGREFVDGFGGLEKLTLEFGQFKPSSLELLIFVRNSSPNEGKRSARFLLGARCGLVSKVALDESTKILVMVKDGIVTYPGHPFLEHDFDEPIIFFVRGC
jgi:hypothetical protein